MRVGRWVPVGCVIWLALAALFLLRFAPFRGLCVVPLDILTADEVFAHRDSSGRKPANIVLSDQARQFYVWHEVAHRGYRANGRMPLWNPYEFCGQPLLANLQSALLYPPNLLLAWVPAARVATVRAVFNLCVAGIFSILLLRMRGYSWLAGLQAGMTFMLSGPIVVWLGHPHANVMVWLPAVLCGIEAVMQDKLRWGLVLLPLSVVMAAFGGHFQTLIHLLTYSVAYAVIRGLSAQSSGTTWFWRKESWVALGVGLGLLGSAIQSLPFLEFLQESYTWASGGRGVGLGFSAYYNGWWRYCISGISIFIPNFFGNPVDTTWLWPFPEYMNYNELSAYVGIVSLTLIAACWHHLRGRPLVSFFLVAGLLALSVAWRLPLFEILNHAPPYAWMNNQRVRFLFTFGMAVLSGMALDQIRNTSDPQSSGIRRLWPYAIPALVLVAVSTAYIFKHIVHPLGLWPTLTARIPSRALAKFMLWNEPKTLVSILSACGALCLITVIRSPRWSPRLRRMVVVIMSSAELFCLAWGYNPILPEPRVSWEMLSPVVTGTIEPDTRVASSRGVLEHNLSALLRLQNVGGYDLPVTRWHAALYKSKGGRDPHEQYWDVDDPFLDFMGVKYIFSERQVTSSGYRIFGLYPGFVIYESTNEVRRAYLSNRITVAGSLEEAVRRLNEARGLSDLVLELEFVPHLRQSYNAGEPVQGKVHLVDRGCERTLYEVQTSHPAILVVADAYAPGWQARVDGVRVPLLRANVAFRAVEVPAGEHKVEFVYCPISVRLGGAMSCISGVIWLLALFIVGKRAASSRLW